MSPMDLMKLIQKNNVTDLYPGERLLAVTFCQPTGAMGKGLATAGFDQLMGGAVSGATGLGGAVGGAISGTISGVAGEATKKGIRATSRIVGGRSHGAPTMAQSFPSRTGVYIAVSSMGVLVFSYEPKFISVKTTLIREYRPTEIALRVAPRPTKTRLAITFTDASSATMDVFRTHKNPSHLVDALTSIRR
jgi:hypothetical protein